MKAPVPQILLLLIVAATQAGCVRTNPKPRSVVRKSIDNPGGDAIHGEGRGAPNAVTPSDAQEMCRTLSQGSKVQGDGVVLNVSPGTLVREPATTQWGGGYVSSGDPLEFKASGKTLVLVPFSNPGNGTGVAVTLPMQGGGCVLGIWVVAFGGDGAWIEQVRFSPDGSNQNVTKIEIDYTCQYHGMGEPKTEEGHVVLRTDARTVW
ncbi:hypothetical protein KKC45_04290 [Patescibacteria group bacterium]|nr:hypothetical protein [Patescibacteria group bacterium]